MVKFFVLSRFIARFYKLNIVFLYFLVTSHNFTVYFQKGFFMINSNTFSNFNSKYPIYADLHTHSISSGHGSEDTITDMIRCASESGLSLFGISDHGPATSSSAKPSYFQSLKLADRDRFGIRVLYGAELNIINTAGDVDLDDDTLSTLDYAIISIHPPIFKPYHDKDLSSAYIRAMDHPKVRFLGHIDDARFPVDFEYLLEIAKEKHVYPEINNGSLMPDAYRINGQENCRRILSICKKLDLPVLLSSDSHGKKNIGNMQYIFPLLEELDFPAHLVLNSDLSVLSEIIQ